MAATNLEITPELYNYVRSNSWREHPVLNRLRKKTLKLEKPHWQIPVEEGQLIALIVKMIHAKKTLEIGVYTGYSTLCTALALPEDGRVIGCDVDRISTNIAKKFWEDAGVVEKITVKIAPASQTLSDLLLSGREMFDFIFIDADKENYDDYYTKSLKLLCPGGVMMIDNVLWRGRVIQSEWQDEDTVAIRNLNQKIHQDQRVDLVMLPFSDGVTIVRKR